VTLHRHDCSRERTAYPPVECPRRLLLLLLRALRSADGETTERRPICTATAKYNDNIDNQPTTVAAAAHH